MNTIVAIEVIKFCKLFTLKNKKSYLLLNRCESVKPVNINSYSRVLILVLEKR